MKRKRQNTRYGKGLALAFFLLSVFCSAEEAGSGQELRNGLKPRGVFPIIGRLDSRDEGFKQLMAGVEEGRRRLFNREKNRENAGAFANSLTIFQYTPREGENLFFLAARCNIPYSALASLNRINHPSMLEAARPLLLPSIPGIFVPQEPISDLERLIASSYLPPAEGDSVILTIRENTEDDGTIFYFFPGEEFGSTERAFFLNTGFRFPLRSYRLTSGYGIRKNPITGNTRLHEGLDLAAPEGTEVYAAGNGIVTEIGSDPVYGNFIVIKHEGSWASLYGHLQRTAATLRSSVKSGSLIGWVGSTGQSTGPHLHFELRQNGKARDPDKYLFLPGGR